MKKLILILLALFLVSCASSRRMMRVSPFANESDAQAPNSQRTNLFPLYYNNGAVNSAIWPIIDWDDQGFAVRPLYNMDGNERSIIFPISSWNTKNKEGWFANFYWGRNYNGLLPLYHYSEDFNYYGLFWKEDESFGLFPLFGKWDDGFHVLNYIKGKDYQFLFPLMYHESGERFWFAEIYDYKKRGEDTKLRFLSLLSQFEFKKGELQSSYLFPLWYQDKDDEKSSLLTPLFYSSSDSNSDLLITPLFGYGSSKDDSFSLTNILGPVYIDYVKGESNYSSYLWPLVITSKSPTNTTTAFLPLTWHSTTEKEKYSKSENYSALGLFHYQSECKEDKDSTSNRLWPLYSYTRNKHDPDFLYNFLTLFHKEKRQNYSGFEILSGLLYEQDQYGEKDNPYRLSKRSLLCSYRYANNVVDKLHYSYGEDYDVHTSQDWRFLIYNYDKNKLAYLEENLLTKTEMDALKNFDFGKHGNLSRVGHNQNHKFIPQFYHRNNKRYDDDFTSNTCKQAAEVLNSKGYECDETYGSVSKAYQKFLKNNLKYDSGSEHNIPILFDGKYTPKSARWEFLWGLAKYKADQKDHHFSVLKFLYKEDGDEKNTARDIFPFIQIDSGEKNGFSFLGHHSLGYLFNWKHDKEKGHRGHFLFIPWG